MRGSVVTALVLLLSLGAGCIGGEEAPGTDVADPVDTDTATAQVTSATDQAQEPLTVESVVEGPSWEVGQWFGYHVFFGVNDTEGIHYDSMVVADEGSSWLLATDDPELAQMQAVMDLMVLGSFAKQDLTATFGGNPWTWYQFPMSDGSTWTASYDVSDEQGETATFELSFNATFNPSIPVGDRELPGFDVVGTDAEGNTILEYDYVPELGWFAHMYLYDPTGPSPDNWSIHLMSMGFGTNWTGTAYVDEATQVLAHASDIAVTGPTVSPSPHASFEVSEDADYLFGYAWTYAFAGAHETMLVPPEGEPRHYEAVGAPFGFQFQFISEEAMAGTWEVGTVGAGGAAGGGALFWEILEQTYEL